MSDLYTSLKCYVEDPDIKVKSIVGSFDRHISTFGKDVSYKPRLVFFDFGGSESFGIVSRDYVDESDYVSSIAEMMYAFSALNATSCVLILDSYITKGSQISNCLYCYFISDDNAHVLCLPYSYNEDSNFQIVWDVSSRTVDAVDLKDHDGVTQAMIELLYVFSHVKHSPFQLPDLLSYYSSNGYQFKAFKNLNVSYISHISK